MRLFRWTGMVLRHLFGIHIPVQEVISPRLPPAPVPSSLPPLPFPLPSPISKVVRIFKPNITHKRSGHWNSKRAQHLRREPYCVACGGRSNLNVHHIVPFHVDPARELDDSNLITLCESGGNCHLMFGHLKDWKSYNPHVRATANSMMQLIKNRPYA